MLFCFYPSHQLRTETTGDCWTLVLTSWQSQLKVIPGSARGFICLTTWTGLDAWTLSWRRFGSWTSYSYSVSVILMYICNFFSSPWPHPPLCIQVPVEPDIDDHLFPTVDTWDRFDPYNQFERYSEPDVGEGGIERQEKPWWWNYFSQSGITPPNWLLRNV